MLRMKLRVRENEESGLLCRQFPPISLKCSVYKSKLRFDPLIFTLPNPTALPVPLCFCQHARGAINYSSLCIQENNWDDCTHIPGSCPWGNQMKTVNSKPVQQCASSWWKVNSVTCVTHLKWRPGKPSSSYLDGEWYWSLLVLLESPLITSWMCKRCSTIPWLTDPSWLNLNYKLDWGLHFNLCMLRKLD